MEQLTSCLYKSAGPERREVIRTASYLLIVRMFRIAGTASYTKSHSATTKLHRNSGRANGRLNIGGDECQQRLSTAHEHIQHITL